MSSSTGNSAAAGSQCHCHVDEVVADSQNPANVVKPQLHVLQPRQSPYVIHHYEHHPLPCLIPSQSDEMTTTAAAQFQKKSKWKKPKMIVKPNPAGLQSDSSSLMHWQLKQRQQHLQSLDDIDFTAEPSSARNVQRYCTCPRAVSRLLADSEISPLGQNNGKIGVNKIGTDGNFDGLNVVQSESSVLRLKNRLWPRSGSGHDPNDPADLLNNNNNNNRNSSDNKNDEIRSRTFNAASSENAFNGALEAHMTTHPCCQRQHLALFGVKQRVCSTSSPPPPPPSWHSQQQNFHCHGNPFNMSSSFSCLSETYQNLSAGEAAAVASAATSGEPTERTAKKRRTIHSRSASGASSTPSSLVAASQQPAAATPQQSAATRNSTLKILSKPLRLVVSILTAQLIAICTFFWMFLGLEYSFPTSASVSALLAAVLGLLLSASRHMRCAAVLLLPSAATARGRLGVVLLISSLLAGGPVTNVYFNLVEVSRSLACNHEQSISQMEILLKPFDTMMLQLNGTIWRLQDASANVTKKLRPLESGLATVELDTQNGKVQLHGTKKTCKTLVDTAYDACLSGIHKAQDQCLEVMSALGTVYHHARIVLDRINPERWSNKQQQQQPPYQPQHQQQQLQYQQLHSTGLPLQRYYHHHHHQSQAAAGSNDQQPERKKQEGFSYYYPNIASHRDLRHNGKSAPIEDDYFYSDDSSSAGSSTPRSDDSEIKNANNPVGRRNNNDNDGIKSALDNTSAANKSGKSVNNKGNVEKRPIDRRDIGNAPKKNGRRDIREVPAGHGDVSKIFKAAPASSSAEPAVLGMRKRTIDVENNNFMEDLDLAGSDRDICEPLDTGLVCQGLNDSDTLCKPSNWAGEAIQDAINSTQIAIRDLKLALQFRVSSDPYIKARNSSKGQESAASRLKPETGDPAKRKTSYSTESDENDESIRFRADKTFSRKTKYFLEVMKYLDRILPSGLLLLVYAAYSYIREYGRNVTYDNYYITSNFKRIDRSRATTSAYSGKSGSDAGTGCSGTSSGSLFPLKNYEKLFVIDATRVRLSHREKEVWRVGMCLYFLFFILTLVVYLFDFLLFWLLKLAAADAKISYDNSGASSLDMIVSGQGVVVDLLDIFIKEFHPSQWFKANDRYPQTAQQQTKSQLFCMPNPEKPDTFVLLMTIISESVFFLIILFKARLFRARNALVGFFYPERERSRLNYLHSALARQRPNLAEILHRVARSNHRRYHSTKNCYRNCCSCCDAVRSTPTPWESRTGSPTATSVPSWSRVCFKRLWRFLCQLVKPSRRCLVCSRWDSSRVEKYSCITDGCCGYYCLTCFYDMNQLCPLCLQSNGCHDDDLQSTSACSKVDV